MSKTQTSLWFRPTAALRADYRFVDTVCLYAAGSGSDQWVKLYNRQDTSCNKAFLPCDRHNRSLHAKLRIEKFLQYFELLPVICFLLNFFPPQCVKHLLCLYGRKGVALIRDTSNGIVTWRSYKVKMRADTKGFKSIKATDGLILLCLNHICWVKFQWHHKTASGKHCFWGHLILQPAFKAMQM